MRVLILALRPYNAVGMDLWHDHGAGMAYMCARKAEGVQVGFLDMGRCRNENELITHLREYDIIAFGLKSSYYSIGMAVIRVAKQLGKQVMVGGYHVTAAPEQMLENANVDWILRGESEITLPKMLSNLIAYNRFVDGEKPKDLDALPWIDRRIYASPIESCEGWWYGGRRRMLSVVAARGCPFQCGFCQPIENNHFGRGVRRRSVQSVIEELLWLKQEFNPECIMIHDDTFFVQNKWLEEFVQEYPRVGLPFWAAARADGIVREPELFRKLVRVGWELVSVGFESGSQRILDKMNKGTTVQQNLDSAKIIKDAGAKVYGNYMLGLPWETKEDVQATARMADQIAAEMPSWAYFTPYPGCDLGRECTDQGWSLLDRNSYDRYPGGRKCKYVDYEYIGKVLSGYREATSPLLVDIVIPSYNNQHYTVECLKSIRECTRPGMYRVIWVDNGSKDTAEVDAVIADMPHLAIKLPNNLGFVGATNTGMRNSTAPYVCLLNNDTVVSRGWLDKMLAILKQYPDIGIIGPMTFYSKVGCDSPHNLNLHNHLLPPESRGWRLDRTNKELESRYSGRTGDVDFVAFLCALIRHDVIKRVTSSHRRYKDGLDSNYDMGMWDDLDYNLTVRDKGWRTVLALDTCITHYGRSTFNLIQASEGFNVDALLTKNRRYLDSLFPPDKLKRLIRMGRPPEIYVYK